MGSRAKRESSRATVENEREVGRPAGAGVAVAAAIRASCSWRGTSRPGPRTGRATSRRCSSPAPTLASLKRTQQNQDHQYPSPMTSSIIDINRPMDAAVNIAP